jgi:LemA protein
MQIPHFVRMTIFDFESLLGSYAICAHPAAMVTSASSNCYNLGGDVELWIIVALLGATVLFVITTYNALVGLRVRGDNSWSDIDVQLKRRHDLIPNLVETVKGYASHEKGTFENIAKFRSMAMQASGPAERAQAENQLTMALKSLFAVAENYPQLRASENFTSLQSTLAELEDHIQNSRRYYNAVVRDLNTKIATFPSNLVAGMFSFNPRQFFEVTTVTEREPVAVKF